MANSIDPKRKDGDNFRMSAAHFNLGVDIRNAFQQGKLTNNPNPVVSALAAPLIKVNADAQSRFAAIGVDGVVHGPDVANGNTFKNSLNFTGSVPDKNKHRGKFAIILQPTTKNGQIVPCVVNGLVHTEVDIKDVGHEFAEIADGSTQLESSASGSATILYKESGEGVKWCIVRLGNEGAGNIFGARFIQTGGAAGNATEQCSWTYTVEDPETDEELATAYDPQNSAGGRWQRHNIGAMQPANWGLVRWGDGGELQTYWCSEQLDLTVCEPTDGPVTP